MIRKTTALRKVSALKRKIQVIRGGQGSGKTISILILLVNHASRVPDREILILSSELTKMRLTVIKDFVKVMKSAGIWNERNFIAGTLYRYPNGSFIKFIGLDKDDVGKGLRSDVAYFNEINKCDSESYRQVATRAGKVIMDYNPDSTFFVDRDVIPREDSDFLQLTFNDNEELPETERKEILNYHKLAFGVPYDPNRTQELPILNSYWANLWEVYGLGNIGALMGVVYSNWSEIDNVPDAAKFIGYGMDFGYTNDPTAIVALYRFDGQDIYDELEYSTGLLNNDIAASLKANGITKVMTGYADSADPKSIAEINRYRYRIKPAKKGADSIMYGIGLIQEEHFRVTKRSHNIKKELRAYRWDTDKNGEEINKPKDKDNHAADAMRYVKMMTNKRPRRKNRGGTYK